MHIIIIITTWYCTMFRLKHLYRANQSQNHIHLALITTFVIFYLEKYLDFYVIDCLGEIPLSLKFTYLTVVLTK